MTTTISTGDNNYNNILNNDNDKLERKIIIATEGLIPYAVKKLRGLEGKKKGGEEKGKGIAAATGIIGRQNIETICYCRLSYYYCCMSPFLCFCLLFFFLSLMFYPI
jgi:hypothetical protein